MGNDKTKEGVVNDNRRRPPPPSGLMNFLQAVVFLFILWTLWSVSRDLAAIADGVQLIADRVGRL